MNSETIRLLDAIIKQSEKMISRIDREINDKKEELKGISDRRSYEYMDLKGEEQLLLGQKDSFIQIIVFTQGLKGENI